MVSLQESEPEKDEFEAEIKLTDLIDMDYDFSSNMSVPDVMSTGDATDFTENTSYGDPAMHSPMMSLWEAAGKPEEHHVEHREPPNRLSLDSLSKLVAGSTEVNQGLRPFNLGREHHCI